MRAQMTAGPPPSGGALLAALRGHLLLPVCVAHGPLRGKPEAGSREGRGVPKVNTRKLH